MIMFDEEYDSNQLKTMLDDFINDYGDSKEVIILLNQFISLWDENLWESLFTIHCKWQQNITPETNNRKRNVPESLILLQAINNGFLPGKNSSDYSVDYGSFHNLYIFLEKLHCYCLGRDLIDDDLWALYQGDLVERILGAMDQFDVFNGILFLKNEFFQEFNQITWDVEAKVFFMKLQNLLISFLFESIGRIEMSFIIENEKILVLLAHTSAILSNSQSIEFTHVLRSYQTLFRIIKSNITDFVDKSCYGGYIECNSCKQVYKLLEHEAPFDFSQCECGGDLKYFSLENIEKQNSKHYNTLD